MATTHVGGPRTLSASSINGDEVVNRGGDSLGKIEDLMVDLENSRISYAVLSFGGFLGMGNKLFAVPFEILQLDSVNKRFILDVPKDRLENAPGFDKDNWPDFADQSFGDKVYSHYETTPYWR